MGSSDGSPYFQTGYFMTGYFQDGYWMGNTTTIILSAVRILGSSFKRIIQG